MGLPAQTEQVFKDNTQHKWAVLFCQQKPACLWGPSNVFLKILGRVFLAVRARAASPAPAAPGAALPLAQVSPTAQLPPGDVSAGAEPRAEPGPVLFRLHWHLLALIKPGRKKTSPCGFTHWDSACGRSEGRGERCCNNSITSAIRDWRQHRAAARASRQKTQLAMTMFPPKQAIPSDRPSHPAAVLVSWWSTSRLCEGEG